MTIDPGEEFKVRATPSPELLRKLAYLAAQGNDSVLTGGAKSPRTAYRSPADKVASTADAVMLARLADPAYQALSARINDNLDFMDEASVHALQEIEEELAELRHERARMLEQAYRDDQGQRIFMTADGSAAYYEDGTRVAEDEFTQHKEHLRGKPTWDEWQQSHRREEELNAEREDIHQHDGEREKLREDLAEGKISKEEAERRERELEQSQPDRVRSNYQVRSGHKTGNGVTVDTELSAEEQALLNVRGTRTQEGEAATPDSDQNAKAGPATDPAPSGPSR